VSELRGKPYNPELDVEALPRRVAHAVHALLSCASVMEGNGIGPFTAAEVCVYDSYEAFSPRHTGAALREAQKRGLAQNWGGYWSATFLAAEFRAALEDRFLRQNPV
jgi:hypothetical protein